MSNIVVELEEAAGIFGAIKQLAGDPEIQAEAQALLEDAVKGEQLLADVRDHAAKLYAKASPALVAELEKLIPALKHKVSTPSA